jgi:hypothetical protein
MICYYCKELESNYLYNGLCNQCFKVKQEYEFNPVYSSEELEDL